MKILLAGSDPDIVHMTQKILRRNAYDVSAAIGYSEMMEALRRSVFALVVFDCDMREIECAEIFRSVRQAADPPFLLVISGNPEDEVPFLRAGADDWMQKPYSVDVLLTRMAVLLRKKQRSLPHS